MNAKRIVDPAQRRAEVMVAALFLVTSAAAIVVAFLLDPILKTPDYLAALSPSRAAIAGGALLWSINNIGIVFIAVYMYPLLKRLNQNAAVGYLAVRIIEGTIMMLGIVATLMLIPLSAAFIKAGAPGNSLYQTLGDSLLQARALSLSTVSLPLLGLCGCIFSWQLVRHRLVPRTISIVGLVGYALVLFGGIAGWFGLVDLAPGSPGGIIAVPVAIFEIILLPFWLFYRGFKMPEALEAQLPD